MHAPILSVSTPLSERDLQTQIQQALSNKLTGQIRLTFLNNKTETIFAFQGTVRQVYIRSHRLPNLKWAAPIAKYGAAILAIDPMPVRALMFRKIILEEFIPTSPQSAQTMQLRAMCDLAEHNPGPTLFHMQWEQAEGFVLVAGKSIPLRHAVLLTPLGAETGPVALQQILTWEEPQCNVTVRRADIKNQAWLEVHLNILFERFCTMILNHYSHLTGSVMVQAVMRKSSALALESGWNIEFVNTEVLATALFPEAAEAGEAYRRIFAAIRSQMEPIIGGALTHNIFKQAFDSSRDIHKNVAEVFEFPGKVSP